MFVVVDDIDGAFKSDDDKGDGDIDEVEHIENEDFLDADDNEREDGDDVSVVDDDSDDDDDNSGVAS